MYNFYYNDLLRKCGRENIELLFTDTGEYLNRFFKLYLIFSVVSEREREREREKLFLSQKQPSPQLVDNCTFITERERERAKADRVIGDCKQKTILS